MAATLMLACSNDKSGGHDGDEGVETEVNGTQLDGNTTLYGLVTDTSGNPVPGVVVSDGYGCVTTDANGVYQMERYKKARFVHYSTPAGYAINTSADNYPLFYAEIVHKNIADRHDFVLTPLPAPESDFTLVCIADPQCASTADISRYVNETIPDIEATVETFKAKGRAVYGITLGDIVFDTPDLWSNMKESMANRNLPVFQTIGNHDHLQTETSDDKAAANFESQFGPRNYSFNRGKAHIVVMDNVVCTTTNQSTWTYEAGFSQQQYNWLKADLDLVENKADKIVFLCCHIPFRNGGEATGSNVNKDKYYDETLKLLTQFKEAHIMIGHTHYPQNYIHSGYKCQSGLPVYEHVHGGACGGWWASNLNVDGAPQGYSIYEIKGNVVDNWVAKATNQSEAYQLRAYDGNATYTGSKKYSYTWTDGGSSDKISTPGIAGLKGCFIASIWNDDPQNWKVEFVQNDKSTPMTRVSTRDMCVVSFFFNECGKNTTTWNKSFQHFWKIAAPGGEPSKEEGWVIRATQTIPGSKKTNVYEASALQTDYAGFAH